MDYTIKTVYRPDDLNGLYNAFLFIKKPVKIAAKILSIIGAVLAFVFWGLAALDLIGAVISSIKTKNIQVLLTSLPLTLFFLLFGLWLYASGHRGFRNRSAWKSYPFKNVELVYRFYSDRYTVSQPSSETTNEYTLIIRIVEDEDRFYLFTSPQTAHILPKRDLYGKIDEFRADIAKAAGLTIEELHVR